MRTVYAISGGVSKFAKARPDKTFQAIVKEAYDYAIQDIGLDFKTFTRLVDGSVASYFSDHFTRQLMAGIMVQDYLGLMPQAGPPGGGRRRDRRHLLPGSLEIGRLRAHGYLRGVRLRDHEPRRDLEGQRVHRPGLGCLLRLPGGRLLLRLLRHDGHPPHEGVRHHRRADGRGERQEPPERFPQPLRPEARTATPSRTCAIRRWSPGRSPAWISASCPTARR